MNRYSDIHGVALGLLLVLGLLIAQPARIQTTTDPLPSWNDGPEKTAISQFITRVTKPGSPDFVPLAERIAAFDNDGALWSEQPIYFQFAFALDRVKALAPQHPEWREQQPFKAVIEGDMKELVESGGEGARRINNGDAHRHDYR